MTYLQLDKFIKFEDPRSNRERYKNYRESAPPFVSTQDKLDAQRVPDRQIGSLFEAVDILELIHATTEDPSQPLVTLALHILKRELGLDSVSELSDDSRITMKRTQVAACVA
jgi:hypothetical protein